MRIWSIHPEYLDAKGLLALWRETLLAKKVLEGKTKGYKNHPQLIRFKESDNPLKSINCYLASVYQEAERRGYRFKRDKIDWNFEEVMLIVTKGQIEYEKKHLLSKLKTRSPQIYKEIINIEKFIPHPMFRIVEGEVENWEKRWIG